MATCPKCESWNDDKTPICVSCGQAISKGGLWSKMSMGILDIPCSFGWHRGVWIYDQLPTGPGPKQCSQSRICKTCGEESVRFEHDVKWESDGFFSSTESGVCSVCQQPQMREKPKGVRS